jgi:uncharacterized membrane protein
MFRFISRTFLKGLAVVLPVAAAVYVVYWLGGGMDAIMESLFVLVFPRELYIPGSGLVVVLLGVFAIGLLMYPVLTRKLIDRVDVVLRKIPLFASIYSPVRDLLNLLGGSVEARLGQVVLVKLPGTGFEVLGFVTRESDRGLPSGMLPPDHVVVMLPWSTQIGGLCFIVPRDAVRPVELNVEEGLRWALTAGISGPELRAEKLREETA